MQAKASRRLIPGLMLALLTALALPAGIGAHAQLIRSEPAADAVLATAPGQVKLFFDEAVNAGFSDVQVLDKSLARVDNGDLSLAPGDAKQLAVTLKPLGAGTYTVVWQAMSDVDGHITRGNFAFSVSAGAGAVAAPAPVGPQAGTSDTPSLAVILRGLSLLALLALVGSFFFRTLLLERSLRSLPGAPPQDTQDKMRARWRQLTWAALILALVTHVASLLAQASLAGAVPLQDPALGQAIWRLLLVTRFGGLWMARATLLLVLVLVLGNDRSLRAAATPVLLGLGVGALLTVSLGGHSAAAEGTLSPALLFDWLHMVAVALWVGGLFHFLAAMVTPAPAGTRAAWLAWMVPHFSALALPATAVIALTGLYNALLQIPAPEALVRTAYGETLAIKVALFGVMIGLGAINLLLISPRLRRAAQGVPSDQSPRIAARFRLAVAAEVLLGVGAIFLAGLLTLEPPARDAAQGRPAAQPAAPSQKPELPAGVVLRGVAAPDVQVALALEPAETPDSFDIYLTDPRGGVPITNTLRVMLQFTLLDQDVGVTTQIAKPAGDGHYGVRGNLITLPGLWRLRAIVRRAGVEDVSAEFPFYHPAGAVQNAPNDPQAMDWLEASDGVMNQLRSLRSTQDLTDGLNGLLITEIEYRAPDAAHLTAQTGEESIAMGPVQYDRGEAGRWTQRQRAEPFIFPKFDLARQATNAKLGRQEMLNGEPVQVVRFKVPDVTPSGIQYAEWISTKDHRLLQFAMVAPWHYMIQSYRDYDSPQISVTAPANLTPRPLP
jgi:copper transport protein